MSKKNRTTKTEAAAFLAKNRRHRRRRSVIERDRVNFALLESGDGPNDDRAGTAAFLAREVQAGLAVLALALDKLRDGAELEQWVIEDHGAVLAKSLERRAELLSALLREAEAQ